ncbi:Mut7-C RNAse domain protein [compost metagenome]
MSGFDTLYDNDFEDGQIAALAAAQQRIVLTRDRELLKRRIVSHGCYVHALKPALQLRELFERLDLARSARPFTLCVHCNLPLHELDTELARARVPPRAAWLYSRFLGCDACQRIYWEGSHWRNMCALLGPLLARAGDG